MSKKTYVLDTSVLLSHPRALFSYGEHNVVIPLVVIKELEKHRGDPEIGYFARMVLRSLDEISQDPALTEKGVVINKEGGTLRVELNHISDSALPESLKKDRSNDTRIIAVAHGLQEDITKENGDAEVILISRDLPMRLLASTLAKLHTEDYEGDMVRDTGYTGVEEIKEVRKDLIDSLFEDKNGSVKGKTIIEDFDTYPIHTGFVIKGPGSASALAIKNGEHTLKRIDGDISAFGMNPRSAEQKIALSHLLDPDIGIVSLGGKAGTGKSVLAIAAGLEIVLEQNKAKKVIVFRPVYSVGGEGIGFLPGTLEEKMDPFVAAIRDALLAMGSQTVVDEIFAKKTLEVQPLAFIRGRSFKNTIIIIDEAQNLEKDTLLSALSRIGEGSRVFMTHDVAQRDNQKVGRYDGVATVIEKLKNEELFAHTTLIKSERSKVAEMVTRLLDVR